MMGKVAVACTRGSTDYRALAADLLNHPRFSDALSAFCVGIPEPFRHNRMAMRAVVEARRWGVAILVAHLHFAWQRGQGGPPTRSVLNNIPQLRQVSGRDGIKGTLDVLMATGLIEERLQPQDLRARRFTPTAALIALLERSLRTRCDVAAHVHSQPSILRIDPTQDLPAYQAMRIRMFVDAPTTPDTPFPETRFFIRQAGGYFLLLAMLRQAEERDGVFHLNKAEAARGLHVTRSHVARMIVGALEEGFIAPEEQGGYRFPAAAHARLRSWIATEIAIDTLAIEAARSAPAQEPAR